MNDGTIILAMMAAHNRCAVIIRQVIIVPSFSFCKLLHILLQGAEY